MGVVRRSGAERFDQIARGFLDSLSYARLEGTVDDVDAVEYVAPRFGVGFEVREPHPSVHYLGVRVEDGAVCSLEVSTCVFGCVGVAASGFRTERDPMFGHCVALGTLGAVESLFGAFEVGFAEAWVGVGGAREFRSERSSFGSEFCSRCCCEARGLRVDDGFACRVMIDNLRVRRVCVKRCEELAGRRWLPSRVVCGCT